MTVLLRFSDLRARNIVRTWPSLRRLIETANFPPGRMIGPNSRAWTQQEVADWLASRPVAGPPLRGGAKARRLASAAGRNERCVKEA
jgi:hypothetical protein